MGIVSPTPTARQMDRVAEIMAGGCPSLAEAAYRTRLTQAAAEAAWRKICRHLGAQAR